MLAKLLSFCPLVAALILASPSLALWNAPDTEKVYKGELKQWRSLPELKGLDAAFRFLARSDLKDLPTGRHTIDGDNVYALITKAPSRASESAQFESHQKYIDIHYLISGQDITGFLPTAKLEVAVPYDEAKDIQFYAVPGSYTKIEMAAGRFAVFFPGQGHLPTLHSNGPHDVHKVVVKVKMDYYLNQHR